MSSDHTPWMVVRSPWTGADTVVSTDNGDIEVRSVKDARLIAAAPRMKDLLAAIFQELMESDPAEARWPANVTPILEEIENLLVDLGDEYAIKVRAEVKQARDGK